MVKHITIFDKAYSKEKITEGLKVQMAVITGKCNTCEYLPRCETDSGFAFPKDAPCMEEARP